MQRAQLVIIALLISTSAIAWVVHMQQPYPRSGIISYEPLALALFAATWTVGMTAMMFPAIVPMVSRYHGLVASNSKSGAQSSMIIEEKKSPTLSFQTSSVLLFIGGYISVWALAGIAFHFGVSDTINDTILVTGNSQLLTSIYGAVLIVAGAYQFTPLKKKCLEYCSSPMNFYMRRWSGGKSGAVKMGLHHGMYCFGTCAWYFVIMVALGWTSLWAMGLFSGLIFAERIWSKGIWISRAAGISFMIAGILVVTGLVPQLLSQLLLR